jgi:hypothetical protein
VKCGTFPLLRSGPIISKSWWARRDSNPHAVRHENLNLACIPISPLAQLINLAPI